MGRGGEGVDKPRNLRRVTRHYPELPDHIHLIAYDDDISSLDFYNTIDGAVTVFGTAGLEISCMGKPAIVAGAAHYSQKGFTHDPSTIDEYYKLLKTADSIGQLSNEQQQLAMRYAYIYFIQRQIPFPPVINPHAAREHGFWRFDPKATEMLKPGENRYVDFVAERILDGREFVMPDQLLVER